MHLVGMDIVVMCDVFVTTHVVVLVNVHDIVC